MLLEELVLLHEIKRGQYRAMLRGQPLIVKLPSQLLIIITTPPTHDHECGTLDTVMKRYDTISVEEFAEARAGLMRECRCAEKVLDPPSERIIRDYHADKKKRQQLSAVECDVIAKGRRRWQNDWPGYAHMHPIVHFDANIPLLLSAPAHGTICDLRFLIKDCPSREWWDVAWQLSEAITFLRLGAQLAHADIKPDNVFYTTQKPDGRTHIWLGDYGLLVAKRRRAGGSHTNNNDHRQLFAYYETVLDLICFPSAEADADWLSRTGGDVSAGLLEAIRTQSPLVTRATPDMYAHIMCPLFDVPLSELPRRFERTREWLRVAGGCAAYY